MTKADKEKLIAKYERKHKRELEKYGDKRYQEGALNQALLDANVKHYCAECGKLLKG